MEELVVRRAGLSPVKGTRHLALDHVDLDEQGPVGDRAFCLVDPAQSRVLRTVQHPSLIGVVARSYDDALTLTLPSGESGDGPRRAKRRDRHLRLLGSPGGPRAHRRSAR